MKRAALMVLLGLGTVLGFGWGIHGMAHRAAHRHARFEAHVAEVCADAALRVAGDRPAGADSDAPHR